MYQLKKILVKVSNAYSLDLRALALMRIAIALIVIADLCIRGADLTPHYTDDGIWPVRLTQTLAWKPYSWSLHTFSGTYTWVLILFSTHFVFATFLLIGFKTRVSTIVVWLLTISLHNRNLFVLQAGDDLLRLILFWGIFLPWNASYALDAKQNHQQVKQQLVANLGYLLLIASVYFFTACLKTGAEWHEGGSAIYYALSLEQIRLALFGDWLYQFPGLMMFLTKVVYLIELIVPFLILFPSKNGYLRFTAFLLLLILQIGIGLTLYVGLFFLISIAATLPLLPAFALDKIPFGSKKNIVSVHRKNRPVINQLTSTFLIVVIAISLTINLGSVNWFAYELKKEAWYPVNALRLDQNWAMFSPTVMKKDGWFVYYGIDSIGRQWDLRLNQDYVDFKKPEHIVKMYKSDRWRKLAENMQGNEFTFLRPRFCKYLLSKWNKEHPEKKILTLNLYFMEKENLLNYKTTPIIKNLHCVCNDL